ncbi:Hypothetical protein NocV09_02900820 [Nannochloropsis oceanica]
MYGFKRWHNGSTLGAWTVTSGAVDQYLAPAVAQSAAANPRGYPPLWPLPSPLPPSCTSLLDINSDDAASISQAVRVREGRRYRLSFLFAGDALSLHLPSSGVGGGGGGGGDIRSGGATAGTPSGEGAKAGVTPGPPPSHQGLPPFKSFSVSWQGTEVGQVFINTLDPSTAGNGWDSASYDVTALSEEERLSLEAIERKKFGNKGGKKHEKKKEKKKEKKEEEKEIEKAAKERENLIMQAREEGEKEKWLTAIINITSTTKGKSSLFLTDVHLYDLSTPLPTSLPSSSPSFSTSRIIFLVVALGMGLTLFCLLVNVLASAKGGWRWDKLSQWHRMEEEEEEEEIEEDGGEGLRGLYYYPSLEMPRRTMEEGEEVKGKGGWEDRRDDEEEVLFQRERGRGRREGRREGNGLPSVRHQREEGYGSTGSRRDGGGGRGKGDGGEREIDV